jgi:hypothetical protein
MENGKTPMEYELHERAKDGPANKNGSNEKGKKFEIRTI